MKDTHDCDTPNPQLVDPTGGWDRNTGFCCATCASYAPKTPDEGRCRYYAPKLRGYPVVLARYDWCGRHKRGTNPSKK